MNVIKIPVKFTRSIKRLPDRDRLAVFDALMKIGDDERITLPDTATGDLIALIYGEWMNMERKNGTRPETSHISGTEHEEEEEAPEKKPKGKSIIIPESASSELSAKIQEFVKFRAEKKSKFVQTQIPAFLKKLETLSGGDHDTAVKILDQSIANGWLGIFELKYDRDGGRREEMANINIT